MKPIVNVIIVRTWLILHSQTEFFLKTLLVKLEHTLTLMDTILKTNTKHCAFTWSVKIEVADTRTQSTVRIIFHLQQLVKVTHK